jgi:hypothetical protein
MVLHLIAALVTIGVVGALALPRLGGRLSDRLRTMLLVGLAVGAFAQATGPDLKRFATSPWVRTWNVFHYYLGAEYFDELGYHDLYRAALAADREGADLWRNVGKVRDLESYTLESRTVAMAGYDPLDHFSPARWEAFRRDVAALQPQLGRRTWAELFTDRGYNPSPFWTVVAARLTGLLPATSPIALKLLAGLDLLLLALAIAALARRFGVDTAALVLLCFSLSPVNDGRIVGGFLQYDWFVAVALGLCWVRDRPVAAAAALAYAALARAFPLAFLGSALLPAVVIAVRHRRLDHRALRLGASFAGFCALGILIGCFAGNGDPGGAWHDFAVRIRHHSELHVYGEQRVGLKHWFTHDQGHLDLDLDNGTRRAIFAAQEPLYLAVAILFLAIYGLAVSRRTRADALLLGLVPIFVLVVASRYYWALFALQPCLSAAGAAGRRRIALLVAGQGLLFAVHRCAALSGAEAYATYSIFNGLLALLLIAWMAHHIRRDVAVLRRARRLARILRSRSGPRSAGRRPEGSVDAAAPGSAARRLAPPRRSGGARRARRSR